MSIPSLHERSLSLDHQLLTNLLANTENILIIQDLDGVCMGLVKDPLTRVIAPEYLRAVKSFTEHFYVLTNGEHIGTRGVNTIIEQAFDNPAIAKEKGFYLSGLGAGGVQWQDCYGNISHLGVSEEELAFLEQVPNKIKTYLEELFSQENYGLGSEQIKKGIAATVLDNKVSPTANLNVFHEALANSADGYRKLQIKIQILMEQLLAEATQKGLKESFFVHYAPNLGRDTDGKEVIQLAEGKHSGTTDFQFMLKGAIKEVGVLVILNRYYYQRTGSYPLGKDFNVREAPHQQEELLEIIKTNFDPAMMPIIVGVGDTVTSKAQEINRKIEFKRGGSDRGFLELIQAIGKEFNMGNVVVYVDSSDGEVKNRKPLKLEKSIDNDQEVWRVVEGAGDSRDTDDPLRLNVVFPGGYKQYTSCFQDAARIRK
ncbi:MAG: glucosylglycerol 3-phosphatase [Xenococcaceae cyanobacterium MO_188.B19]|nr:glucosylglycerol 3-phosphatase [Xenococcaceae cyanobacterium MO_188.B19]